LKCKSVARILVDRLVTALKKTLQTLFSILEEDGRWYKKLIAHEHTPNALLCRTWKIPAASRGAEFFEIFRDGLEPSNY